MNLFTKGDERQNKETFFIISRIFPVAMILDLLLLAYKIVGGMRPCVFALDIAAFIIPMLVLFITRAVLGILLVKKRDDAIKELLARTSAYAFFALFAVENIGTIVLIVIFGFEYVWMWSSILVWLVPGIVATILFVSRGAISYGSTKVETNMKKRLLCAVCALAPVNGIVIMLVAWFAVGSFDPLMLLIIPAVSLFWGGLFYAYMIFVLNRGEKNADKKLREVENGNEK